MVMRKVRNATAEILDNITLADVCHSVDRMKQGVEEADPMYFI
jgi:DNA-binding IscR family transcriptional regulator